MIKSYIIYGDSGTVKQFTRCDETEIDLYQSLYIEHSEDSFEFDSSYTYKVEDGLIVKTKRTDEAFIRESNKIEKIRLVSNIEVEYNGIVYQGDETSQDRMSRAIAGLPEDGSIQWKAKDNSINELTKADLKEILFLAGQKQTEIWFN